MQKEDFTTISKKGGQIGQKEAQKKLRIDPKSYISIEYEDDDPKKTSILYLMPISQQKKIFHPQDWSIDNFEIGRPLGKGGFGRVYLAREKKRKYVVALKVLQIKELVKNNMIGQVKREIEIHSHFDHPHILKMFGFFWDQKRIYYIMEYAPGGDLFDHLKKARKFDEKKAAKFMKQIIEAMIYIHSWSALHRDIKPENILVSANDTLKISDFGWSARILAKRKTFCGTLDYNSPEMIENCEYGKEIDIWSMGVLAYELTTGKTPFFSSSVKQLHENIRHSKIKFPQYMSGELLDFIRGLLKNKPEDRMSLQKALEHLWLKMHC